MTRQTPSNLFVREDEHTSNKVYKKQEGIVTLDDFLTLQEQIRQRIRPESERYVQGVLFPKNIVDTITLGRGVIEYQARKQEILVALQARDLTPRMLFLYMQGTNNDFELEGYTLLGVNKDDPINT